MPKRQPASEDRIGQLKADLEAADAPLELLRRALADSSHRLVALAAEKAGFRLLYGLEGDLVANFRRLAGLPHTQDPRCTAKAAIARALVGLDYPRVEFYLEGIRLRQLEPVWGGTQDSAVDVRVTCALGLAGTGYGRALPELATLLGDREARVRAGVMDAIACCDPVAAEAVLRTKALAGDPEPEVTGACLLALLKLEPALTVPFVGTFLECGDPTLTEIAALALGESRCPEAVMELRSHWEAAPLKETAQLVLLKGAVLHRSDEAFSWLLGLVADGERRIAERLIRDLAIYRGNDRLRQRLADATGRRCDPELLSLLTRVWPLPRGGI